MAMFRADCSVIPMLRLPRKSSNFGRSDCLQDNHFTRSSFILAVVYNTRLLKIVLTALYMATFPLLHFSFGMTNRIYCDDSRLSVCVSVCLSLAASPHYCTDPDVTDELSGVPRYLCTRPIRRICNRCTGFVLSLIHI